MEPERIELTGVPVHNLRDEAFEETIYALTENRNVHQIVFLSLWDLMRARRNGEFLRCVQQSALVIPTSPGIPRGAKFLKKTIPGRYMPFDFLIRLLAALESRGRSLYLLGCRPQELRNIEQNLKQTFPGLKIVGRYTGYYPKAKDADIRIAIKKAAPHCVLIGSGVRGKEKWISRHKNDFASGVFIWSPSVMDIISGKRRKVSKQIFQKGWDFFPELVRHPWRIFRGIIYLYYGLLLMVYRIRKQ
jgi:N-acetylglucosaminyldiphosphoundecaprenol N-acetyl-beta-D-mannosaminyltransferase